MLGVDVIIQWQIAHTRMGQHTGVFAGTIMAVWRRLFPALPEQADSISIHGRMAAAQQILLADSNFLLDALDHFHMFIGARMRSTDYGTSRSLNPKASAPPISKKGKA